jgi:GGDEF domain-containing protein
VAGWVQTSLDVTAEIEAHQEVERAHDRLWHLATQALTGLPNRPAVLERLDEAWPGNGSAAMASLLFCDLDSFKPSTTGTDTRRAARCSGRSRRLLRAVRDPMRWVASVAMSS